MRVAREHIFLMETFLDVATAGGTIAALLSLVPPATAVISLFWVCIRLWETQTFKRLLKAVCTRCYNWWWGG